jgi:hypothetical protein
LNKFKSAFSQRRTQYGHLLLARYLSKQIQSRALVPLEMLTSWHATIVSIGSSIVFQSNFVRQQLHSASAEFPFLTITQNPLIKFNLIVWIILINGMR